MFRGIEVCFGCKNAAVTDFDCLLFPLFGLVSIQTECLEDKKY